MLHILRATEKACATYLANSGSLPDGTSIYMGLDNASKEAPYVVCYCPDASEEFPQSGIWHVKTQITSYEIANLTDTTSSLVGAIYEAMVSTTIETDLQNSISNYAVLKVLPESPSNNIDGDAWAQTLNFEIVCALTD